MTTDVLRRFDFVVRERDRGAALAALMAKFGPRAQVGFDPPRFETVKVWIRGWGLEAAEVAEAISGLNSGGFNAEVIDGFDRLSDEELAEQVAIRCGMKMDHVVPVVRSDDPELGREWALQQLRA